MSKNNHPGSKKYLFYVSTKTLQLWLSMPIEDPCDYYSHCTYKKLLEQRKRGKFKEKKVNKRPWRRERNYYKKLWGKENKSSWQERKEKLEYKKQKRIEELQFLTEELEKVHNLEEEND